MTDRTTEHKAKLATDPRFAGWQALHASATGRGPAFDAGLAVMADGDPDPAIAEAAQRRIAEQLELTRRAKYSFLLWAQDNPETDPKQIAEARQFLADHPPLGRPLGDGGPAA